MKISKKIENSLNDKLTYTLNKMGGKNLINKPYNNTIDNAFQQFLLIDKELKVVATSAKYAGYISISEIFPCDDENRFLVFSRDPYKLLYGDFAENIIFTVDITNIQNKYFSRAYLWLKDSILLATDDEIYEFDILERRLKTVDIDVIKELHEDFYKFQNECKEHTPIIQADFVSKNYIYLENYLKFDDNLKIVYVDLKKNKIKRIEDPYNNYHDIIFHKGYFIIIAKKVLTIIKDKKTYTYPMKDKLYIFARAAGIDDSENLAFIVLECYQGAGKTNRLVRYELS